MSESGLVSAARRAATRSTQTLRGSVIALLLSPLVCGAESSSSPDDVYSRLAAAYQQHNAKAIADAYTSNATTADFSNSPESLNVGNAQIQAAFEKWLIQPEIATAKLDIVFRVAKRVTSPDRAIDSGLYRFRAIKNAQVVREDYGRYFLELQHGPDGNWRIATDVSTPVSENSFEETPAPIVPSGSDFIDSRYYDNLTGNYTLANGCMLVVTRSLRRLFVENRCTGDWYGLRRVSGREWVGGDTVASPTGASVRATFPKTESGNARALEITVKGAPPTSAARFLDMPRHDVRFQSADGTWLAGTLTIPPGAGRRPAVVLIHGSGSQDRHGYASIIDVLAGHFLRNGIAVLQYDKRGSGLSEGDWTSASLQSLAADALAARRLLMSRPGINFGRVGLAGSSQAGWVVATAVKASPDVPFVFLLGAGGAALNIQQQDDYNVGVMMRCAGIGATDVQRVLQQHDTFFAAKQNPSAADELRRATKVLQGNASLGQWLMPDTVSRDAHEWYVALDTAFKPVPIWRAYQGQALFAFGGMDDATPGALEASSVREFHKPNMQVLFAPGAQHLGLLATDVCHAGLEFASRFDRSYWMRIDNWIGRQQR